jgi:peptidoglycan hydrolase CwlO-like protein
MLLSEIVFLRDKEKQHKKKTPSNSRILNDLNSEQSQVCEDLDEYKKIIEFMTEEMNDVHKKLMEKDMKIEKLEAQMRRYEQELL